MSLTTIKRELARRLVTVTGIPTKSLSGTVTKTQSSAAVVGVNTAFLSELRVGAVLSIPGTAVEYFVVTAIASDTALTLDAAAQNSASAQTATLYGVHIDEPDTTPTEAQMPCVIAALPRISPKFAAMGGSVECTYHFELYYLKHPLELALPREASAAMDAYLADTWTALAGALTLAGQAKTGNFDGDVTRPLVQYRGTWFWGTKIPWRVIDSNAVTVTA